MSENERIVEMCEFLRKELFENGYSYGFFKKRERKFIQYYRLSYLDR